jgi:hypothetical protein
MAPPSQELEPPTNPARFTPETTLMGKKVCATGTIKAYHGKPEIIASEPQQLR